MLNKQQLQAIKHTKGPLLVIAGAGTGKTTVITERIKFLVSEGLAKPEEILALTFTEKAAQEMEERVDKVMPMGYTQMWISTFHDFGSRVLRAEALQIGLDPSFKLLSTATSTKLIRDNIFDFNLKYFRPLGNPNKFIYALLTHFSRLQDENISPDEYLKWVKNAVLDKEELKKYSELANAYKFYSDLKIKNSYMDFGDLITKTIFLFQKRPNVLKTYQKKFKYVLIDEFQDTNFAQNLLSIILTTHGNITVAGDDDQSIYRFRGAAVSNIIHFRKIFPKAKIVVLTKNYRSTQEILDKAYCLIQYNNPDRLEVVENIDKRLTSQREIKGKKIKFIFAGKVEDEADLVAKKIKKLSSKYNFKDFAILVRANAHATAFQNALNRLNISNQFLGPEKLFQRPEIIDLISFLKVINNPFDSISLYRFLSQNYFNISERDLALIGNFSRRKNISLFESIEKLEDLNISKKTKKKMKFLIKLIKNHLKLKNENTPGEILYNFIQEAKILENLLSTKFQKDELIAQNISKFFYKLKSFETTNKNPTVQDVVDWIELSEEIGESPLVTDFDWTQEDAVNVLTIHSAKGLEFPVVFLVNLVSLRFPSVNRSDQLPIPESLIKEIMPAGDYHLEEERRLFYVGMTRARDLLFFSAARFYSEAKTPKKLSPFLIEALGEKNVTTKALKNKNFSLNHLSREATVPTGMKWNQPLVINSLSYSQIDSFLLCPLHYKLKYNLKIPTPPNGAITFGTSIHETLKDFYSEVKSGKSPTKNLLKKLLEKNWIQDGFINKAHEKKYWEKGTIYLEGFLKNGFNPKILSFATEQTFTSPLKNNLNLKGRIDRIDSLPNGKIEITDYKTGEKVPTQKEVDKNKQLTFYALAATKIHHKPFVSDPKNITLSLYYFENQVKLSTTRTKKDLEDFEKEIYKIRDEIQKSKFTCSGNFLCQFCEYAIFCRANNSS